MCSASITQRPKPRRLCATRYACQRRSRAGKADGKQGAFTVAKHEDSVGIDGALRAEPCQACCGVGDAIVEARLPVITLAVAHAALVVAQTGESLQSQEHGNLAEGVDAEFRSVVIAVRLPRTRKHEHRREGPWSSGFVVRTGQPQTARLERDIAAAVTGAA